MAMQQPSSSALRHTPYAPASRAAASSPTAASGRPAQVLLVDDDVLVARAYERSLKATGYAVRVVNDPCEALALAASGLFDVVVSDVKMPGMTGLDLLRAIRERDQQLPVILMTGSPELQTAADAIEHGALRYLMKPVKPEHLADAVAYAFRLRQLERTRQEALAEMARGAQQGINRSAMQAGLTRALAGLWMAYQPIVAWSTRSVFAYEALVRTREPSLRNPCDLFAAADACSHLFTLGRTIRREIAANIPALPVAPLVFVNVHPADLEDPELLDPAAPLSAFASRVVLEITERAALDAIPDLTGSMTKLRALGYRIAVDDLGAGYAGLNSFAQLEPEVVKVDLSIVRGIDQSCTKQKLVRSIVNLCRDLGIQLICEGIETAQERDTIAQLGGDLCQGYLFARPANPAPVADFT